EVLLATLSGRRSRLDTLEGDLTHARRARALADADVNKRVRVCDAHRKALVEIRERLAAARAEAHALQQVDRAFEAVSPALAWALSHHRELPGFVGPLAERIRVPSEYERLVEHLLGTDLFALLVERAEDASDIATAAESQSEGELVLVPLAGTGLVPRATATTGTSILSVIECDDAVAPALAMLLGDVFVVESLSEALDAVRSDSSGARFATLSGSIVWPGGKVTVGRVLATDGAGVLERKRRITELEGEVAALEIAVGDAEAVVSTAEDALAAAQQDALDLGQRIAHLAGEHDSVREETGRLEQALTSHDADVQALTTRMNSIDARAEKEAPEVEPLRRSIAESQQALERLDEDAAAARDVRDAKSREEAAVGERLSSCQVDIATVSEREIHLKRQAASISAELAELERAVAHSRDTEAALELLRERVEPVHALYTALLERAEHWAVRLRDRARFEQADSVSLRTTIHEAQDAVRAIQTEIDAHSAQAGDVRVEKAQLEVQVNAAVAKIVEGLGVPIERALEGGEQDGDRRALEDRAHSVRKRLDTIGPVNPIAVEEFEALQERRGFMHAQMDDLVVSRQALGKVVAAVDRKMRDRFLETFEQVGNHFQEVFAVLFPGGHCSLEFTEPDSPETTGVEVVAQPRGKKLTKMSLMSGGEKSLTALALLFAVYRTRPCPFYILDEVEAALDDTNLRRFIAFTGTMRTHTQFIIVTHQRRTMEMADVLYGVSMHADGVSKVVSHKLERTPEKGPDDHTVVQPSL
ncbi:MAG TPA: chromosome segregation protein SMC, partial [Coriobacteriia bacterium]|nr:chromosome segregation protein SMC [Coriobacteriia bacterium]